MTCPTSFYMSDAAWAAGGAVIVPVTPITHHTIDPLPTRCVDDPTIIPLRKRQYKWTLVLDIDETLLYARVETQISLRPHVREFLARICAMVDDNGDRVVEIGAWSAGVRLHVDRCLRLLDPTETIFDFAVCRGSSWLHTMGPPVKQLDLLPWRKDSCLLVEDTAYAASIRGSRVIILPRYDGSDVDTSLCYLYDIVLYVTSIVVARDIVATKRLDDDLMRELDVRAALVEQVAIPVRRVESVPTFDGPLAHEELVDVPFGEDASRKASTSDGCSREQLDDFEEECEVQPAVFHITDANGKDLDTCPGDPPVFPVPESKAHHVYKHGVKVARVLECLAASQPVEEVDVQVLSSALVSHHASKLHSPLGSILVTHPYVVMQQLNMYYTTWNAVMLDINVTNITDRLAVFKTLYTSVE